MDISAITKAYFIGVGGIGVSAVMRLFARQGIIIAGSDQTLPSVDMLPPGQYFEGADAAHVPDDAAIVIYSPAVPPTHVERMRAVELGIPALSYPESLALVTKNYYTIAVSGTHGKSTTTALLGKLFEADTAKKDASVIVGADVPGWDHNFHKGQGDLFVVEACEYRRNMMHLAPQSIVLTNIELDHPDYYRDLADVKSAFHDYVHKLSGEDLLIVNNDDANIRDVVKDSDAILIRFGIGGGTDLFARNITEYEDEQTFELVWKDSSIGVFSTPLPGLYNLYNILAASAAYLAHGGSPKILQSVFTTFIGVGRRFEVVGKCANAIVVSDYAHHPTALKAVVAAATSRYRGKKVLTVFRPHHRERTIKLFDEFVQALLLIPHCILLEIYDVPGREEHATVSSHDLITEVFTHDSSQDVMYAKDLSDATSIILNKIGQFDVILVVGAGDTDQLAQQLVNM